MAKTIKISVVLQNDRMLYAFESTSKAEAFKDKKKAEYQGIPLGNYFHIEHLFVELENGKK